MTDKTTRKLVQKPKREKVNFDSLQNAIVDGKFIAKQRQQVFFKRTLNKRTAIHYGIVLEILDNQSIVIYDELVGQHYTVNLAEGNPEIRIKT